jgi:hypothetical protein
VGNRRCFSHTGFHCRSPKGDEQYVFKADPSQRNDVASEYPEVSQRLKGAYNEWWGDISERFDRTHAEPSIGLALAQLPVVGFPSDDI